MKPWFMRIFGACGVVDSKAPLSAERKLATLRRLCGKFVLRKADGSRVEDQSLWGGIVSEHFKKKFRCSDAVCRDAIREFWRLRVNGALRHGHSPGELRYAVFCEASERPRVETTSRARFSTCSQRRFAVSCIARWWKGWRGVKMSTSRTGQSTTSVWYLRMETFHILVAGDRSP